MEDSLLDGVAHYFGGDTLGALAGLVGADQDQTGKAVAAALPMLVGSIAGHAQSPQGQQNLFGALDKDHDGSILDMLGPMLGGGYASRAMGSDGNRILGHVLGNRRPAVESTVARNSGMDTSLIQKLLPILAPIVMGYIGRKLRGDGLDAGGLGSVLGGEQSRMRESDSGLGSIIDILGGGDNDDDGGGLMDLAGDLLGSSAGKAILGQVLGGR